MDDRRILLIDDSPLVLKALRTILELHPTWKIVGEANSGEDGLELFLKTNPNVVIIDFQMPGINGVEVGRRIRQTNSDALLILFSMHAEQQFQTFARAAGFDAVLSKGAAFPIVGIIEAMKAETRNDCDSMTPVIDPARPELYPARPKL
jgi:two-component system, NarL family, invasion response regulator UvrY